MVEGNWINKKNVFCFKCLVVMNLSFKLIVKKCIFEKKNKNFSFSTKSKKQSD